jgi:anti-sigma28 factor (negative regulator of flagellin synthesis)
MPPKTAREREEAKKAEKLENMKKQIEDGSLTVRKMTPAEKKASEARPPKPPRPKRGR